MNDEVSNIIAKYNELIMAVESKMPGETRHETALRYIKEKERPKQIHSCDIPGCTSCGNPDYEN